jgi:hypothetical protein
MEGGTVPSPLERLSMSDPAAAGYVPAGLDAMVTRVVRSRPPRDPAWRLFRLRVAGAAASAALLTGAGVVALGVAGNALPVLDFAAASTPHSTGAKALSGSLPTMMMPLMRNWSFSAGASLSTQAGSATVYSLAPGAAGAAPLTSAAAALGLDIGTPTTTDGSTYSSSAADFTAWLSDSGGYAAWGILSTSPAATPDSSTIASTATSAFDAQAVADAQALGATVGAPSDAALGADPSGPVQVTLPVLVGGLSTPFTYDFEFAADGTLLGADGVSVATTALGDYPLLSPADGVAQIPAQLYLATPGVTEGFASPFATVDGASSGAAPPSNPPADSGAVSPAPGTTTPSTVAPPPTVPVTTDPSATTAPSDAPTTTAPPVPVTVTSVSEEYGAFPMSDGSTLLLPVYVYSGTDPSGDQLTFRVIPVEPSYLDLSSIVRVMMY